MVCIYPPPLPHTHTHTHTFKHICNSFLSPDLKTAKKELTKHRPDRRCPAQLYECVVIPSCSLGEKLLVQYLARPATPRQRLLLLPPITPGVLPPLSSSPPFLPASFLPLHLYQPFNNSLCIESDFSLSTPPHLKALKRLFRAQRSIPRCCCCCFFVAFPLSRHSDAFLFTVTPITRPPTFRRLPGDACVFFWTPFVAICFHLCLPVMLLVTPTPALAPVAHTFVPFSLHVAADSRPVFSLRDASAVALNRFTVHARRRGGNRISLSDPFMLCRPPHFRWQTSRV